MIFEDLITENKDAFLQKVTDVCSDLGIDPNWLMLCMWIESRLNSRARNSSSGATGLIQFMPVTALSLGTTTEELAAMSNVDQMDYVYKYLESYQWKMTSFVDVYFAIFFPRAIGKDPSYVLQTSSIAASTIARQNSGYDLNSDGQVTVAEVEAKILSFVPAGQEDLFKKKT